MPMLNRQVLSDITRVLSSIRGSLDSLTGRNRSDVREEELLQYAYLSFERVRFAFRSDISRGRIRNSDQTFVHLSDLNDGLASLLNDETFVVMADRIPYRPFPAPREEGFDLNPALLSSGISVAEALDRLADSLRHIQTEVRGSTTQADLFESVTQLAQALPKGQGLAPVRFDVVDEKVVVARTGSQIVAEDSASIEEAFEELNKGGQRIIEDLTRSNCDPRLITGVKELQEQLSSQKDIIRLGLSNLGLDIICDKLTNEIPDALSAMLKAHTVGMNLYVSQFPEWRRFTEQAAQANLQEGDVPALKDALTTIASGFEANPALADPEVPRVLRLINSFLDQPNDLRRYAFAAWRTVENIVIRVCQYGVTILKRTADEISNQLPKTASTVIIRSMMAVTLAGILSLAPVASHIPEGAWLLKAAGIVETQIEKLITK